MPWHPSDPDFTEEFAMEQFNKGLIYNEDGFGGRFKGEWICHNVKDFTKEYKESYRVIGTTMADDGGPAGYVRAYCNTLEQALIFIEMCGGCGIEYPFKKASQDKCWLFNYGYHTFWSSGALSKGITDGISTTPEYVQDEKTGIKVKMSQFGRYQSPPYERPAQT